MKKYDGLTFEEFYLKNRIGLKSYLWTLSKSSSDYDEVVNDAFLILYESYDESRGTAKTYLYRVAMNKLFRMYNINKRLDVISYDNLDFDITCEEFEEDDELDKQKSILNMYIEEMTELDSEIFKLRKSGLGFKEISLEMNLDFIFVKNRFYYVVERIKNGKSVKRKNKNELKDNKTYYEKNREKVLLKMKMKRIYGEKVKK
jgi:RNA polymerase sigma factor (sigma-70 family)